METAFELHLGSMSGSRSEAAKELRAASEPPPMWKSTLDSVRHLETGSRWERVADIGDRDARASE